MLCSGSQGAYFRPAGGGKLQRNDEFRVEVEIADGTARLRLLGELDMGTSDEFLSVVRSVPLNGGRPSLALDLEALSFIDSTGLRALLSIVSESVARGHRVSILHPRPAFLRVVELTGLASHFEPHFAAGEDSFGDS